MTRLLALAIAALLPVASQADEKLWSLLKTEPNLVVLVRHTNTTGRNGIAWDASGNCSGELMLTEKGKTQARELGKMFSSRGISTRVISSPMCRCLDTARIAFGTQFVSDPELREIASADEQRTSSFEKKARALIAASRGPAPVVFVSHRPNIDHLTMELIDEGDLLLARANAGGEVVDVLGKITLGR